MDQYLAQIYGTASGASEDLEKTAQAQMLHKLAEDEGIDLSGLTDEQMDALAQQVISDQDGVPGEQATAEEGVSAEEEAQAKFAEADFLGRVMAHAYTQELQKIAEEETKKEEEKEKKMPPFMAAKKEEEEKTASGPIAAAIQRLGGHVEGGNTAEYVEKLAEARAEELAVGWLRQNGYIQ